VLDFRTNPEVVVRALFLFAVALASFAACSASDGSGPSSGGGAGTSGAAGSGGGGGLIDSGLNDGAGEPPPTVATLHGTVLAPEGTIPISGALVYLTPTQPGPIPDHLYCDKCVTLDYTTPYTFTNPDGSFNLGAYQTGSFLLVVQKGQFRRIRPIDVTAGDVAVSYADTELPNKTDPANGDTIPKMAIVNMAWDNIDVSLSRLGLGTGSNSGPFGTFQIDRATAPYDYYDGLPGSKGSANDILSNPAIISQYNIVFLPCSWSDSTTCYTSSPAQDANVQANLRSFVEQGGKLYVTDYSYEFVRQIFPGYVSWKDETSTLGSACLQGAWDGPASSPDADLTAWLATQGITTFDVLQNWTAITGVHQGDTTDPDGNPIQVKPKVWVKAQTDWGELPATVSFEQVCGRVLFSSYHTEGASATLIPQERALLYVLLEVSVCVAPPQVR
jgi:hypothetical protein